MIAETEPSPCRTARSTLTFSDHRFGQPLPEEVASGGGAGIATGIRTMHRRDQDRKDADSVRTAAVGSSEASPRTAEHADGDGQRCS